MSGYGFSVITTIEIKASSYDLTDVATAKDELVITDTSKDTFLTRAVTEASSMISKYCSRTFNVEQIRDDFYWERQPPTYQFPRGPAPLQLTRWPVIDVVSVIQTLDSTGTTQTLSEGVDFTVNNETGELMRLRSPAPGLPWVQVNWETFPVSVRYSAGYGELVESEAQTIPATPYQVTVAEASEFVIDRGVTFAIGGTALTLVTGTPSTGQYEVNAATGVYTFAAADTGKGVLISYIYEEIPDDLALAALRLTSVRFSQRGGRDPMLVSISQPGIGDKRWWVGAAPGQKGSLPPEVAGLLDGIYRSPVVN